jgi:DNA-binding transcriptional regulator/RsmH inhibitor MraZ
MTTTQVINKVVQEIITEQVSVEFEGESRILLNDYLATRRAVTDLEKTKKALEEQVKALIGNAEVVTVDGIVRIEVSSRSRAGTDRKLLEKLFPEAFTATQTVTDYTVLMPK